MMDIDTSTNQKTPWIDLADLSGFVASMTAPDRRLDALIEVMLAGRCVLRTLSLADLKDSQWLSSEIPEYSKGGAPLRVLLQRRGIKVRIVRNGDLCAAVASDPFTGASAQSSGPSDVVATLLALILLETTRPLIQ